MIERLMGITLGDARQDAQAARVAEWADAHKIQCPEHPHLQPLISIPSDGKAGATLIYCALASTILSVPARCQFLIQLPDSVRICDSSSC